MQLPDLRYDDMITTEHCSVLQERLGKILETAYPGDDLFSIVNTRINPELMKTKLLEIFTPKALLTMFQTELGKGVIIGAFIQKFIFGEEEE